MHFTASPPVQGNDRVPTQQDLDTLSRQLNRPVRDVVEIPARCVCGNPLVAATAPRLSNGIPFPTTYYLTHPVITAAVSRLEAAGMMNTMSERLLNDRGVEAIMLGGTDLALAFNEQTTDFPLVDCAGIHVEAIVRLAMG